MKNCTGNENFTSAANETNPLSTVTAHIFLSVLNVILSITAFLGNALILIALRKVSSLYPPTKLLFGCLTISDLCVGLISQPLFAAYITLDDVTKTNLQILNFLIDANDMSSFILIGVSMFTSTAISVDRLLALSLGPRYRHVVTSRRVRAVIVCFWLVSSSSLLLQFFSLQIAKTVGVVFVILSLVVSVFSYTKIFIRLRQHQAQVQDHVDGQPSGDGSTRNIARYKKTVSSIAWVQLALIACYVPYIASSIIIQANGWKDTKIVSRSTATLVYLNSSLNPLLYCWKIKELRQAVKGIVRQFRCLSS